MSGTDIVIYVLSAIVLLCLCALCVFIWLAAEWNKRISSKDAVITTLCETAKKDFKEIVRWQSEYMDAEARCDKLTIANKQLKAEYDDIRIKYDVVYTEYGYCKQERDDYKKRLEKYEHNVI